MYVNCAHGKGIKFIREELKFFAKTHIHSNGGDTFKSIVLFNGDKLTMDAQSALRRCISEPEYNGKIINLYKYNLEQIFKLTDIKNQRNDWLKKEIQKSIKADMTDEDLQTFVTKLYEKAYNALDIIKLIEDGCFLLDDEKRYELLIAFNKIRKEFRNEKLLLMFVINFTFLEKEKCLENMTFI